MRNREKFKHYLFDEIFQHVMFENFQFSQDWINIKYTLSLDPTNRISKISYCQCYLLQYPKFSLEIQKHMKDLV